jgi:BirA family transcriptional regulator, biotin operon repressor / biotin---[acetyl-CoA-carboxylase] ligase
MLDDGARQALSATRFTDVRWVPETGSTNTDVLALARAGAPEGVVLVADHQTAGRGRLDRKWEAPRAASLLMSVLLRPQLPPARLHLATAVVALAARDGCAAVAGVTPGLKWPNDLVVDDRKLAGVLAEAVLDGDAASAVVVGIGVNVGWALEGATRLGDGVDRGALLVALLRALDSRYGDWDRVAREHRAACVTIGRDVTVDTGTATIEGRAIDLSDDGHLVVVDRRGGRHTIAVGDVVSFSGATQ